MVMPGVCQHPWVQLNIPCQYWRAYQTLRYLAAVAFTAAPTCYSLVLDVQDCYLCLVAGYRDNLHGEAKGHLLFICTCRLLAVAGPACAAATITATSGHMCSCSCWLCFKAGPRLWLTTCCQHLTPLRPPATR